MIASFQAEILKLRKRPATWVLLGVALALTQLFGYLLPYSSWATSDQNFQTEGMDPQAVLAGTLPGELVPTSLGGFPVFAGALALILGALATGSEYGWGTMQTALTQRPTRLAVYGGKLAALAASTQTTPRPMGRATPRNTNPSRAPRPDHIPRISQPDPMPWASSARGG